MDKIVLRVGNGEVQALYTEKINLKAFGKLSVERASNVEYDNDVGCWTVQLADGRFLTIDGFEPSPASSAACPWVKLFTTREEALAAEVDFLQRELAYV